MNLASPSVPSKRLLDPIERIKLGWESPTFVFSIGITF
jgi:hypothetical protein